MTGTANRTVELLDQLIGFDTTSHLSNLNLISFIEEYLARHGVATRRIESDDREKSNLLATIGPDIPGGVVLSGHTDVVPVTGQDWSSNPFTLDTRLVDGDARHYGRGSADMKGFIATVLAQVPKLVAADLKTPIHIALSYDEEVGCLGVGSMIEKLGTTIPMPAIAIVGEPTSMQIVTGHKGIRGFETVFTGVAAHSSAPHLGVNSIVYAATFITFLQSLATEQEQDSNPESGFTPPWTTFNVGLIQGGEALNIIAERCAVSWEFRPLPETDFVALEARVRAYIDDEIRPALKAINPATDVEIHPLAAVPPMHPDPDSAAERLARHLTGANTTHTVAYVAEASQFQKHGIPTVLCGPGDIAQAHQPDEWIAQSELDACEDFLDRLQAWAASGDAIPNG
ncbi:MAG: acetylornithine deacetylase [Alphaproteobacteria bacterium]|nr:acetylornithine deacetylase [Alphaproteobacteria bacterium]